MLTKGCGILGPIAAAMMLPWTLDHASAAGFVEITAQVKLKPKPPVSVTTTSPISGKIQLSQKFSSISSVCFHFVFQDDLLDAGDTVRLFTSSGDIGGFFNPGSAPQNERVLCANPEPIDPIFTNLLDGKDDLTITMEAGSLTINSLSITVTGDAL